MCGKETDPGRKEDHLYKSNVKNARISFERNKIRANIEMIDGTTQDSSYDVDMSAFMELPKQGI